MVFRNFAFGSKTNSNLVKILQMAKIARLSRLAKTFPQRKCKRKENYLGLRARRDKMGPWTWRMQNNNFGIKQRNDFWECQHFVKKRNFDAPITFLAALEIDFGRMPLVNL